LIQGREILWQMGGEFLDKREVFNFSIEAMLSVATAYFMLSACSSVMDRATAVLPTRISKLWYPLITTSYMASGFNT
jgi:hypothetical protein